MKTKLHYQMLFNLPTRILAASFYILALLLGACTAESDKTDRSSTGEANSTNKREVLLSFKNKLTVKTTKAETKAITTEAENEIVTLDVYVFGAKTEGDAYTFRERFSYRQDGAALPAGAKELNLTPGTDNTTTTALLELQKGLFVRLYCIANQTELINPVDNNPVTDTYFTPLTYDLETGVLTDGIPTERQFQKFYSPLLTDASEALDLPLPMTGSQTTPIDLTDFGSSARVQVGFKLTRTMARFDVNNVEAESKFHLESISMGNGRRGTTFFPVKVYGTSPSADGDLITYPAHTFEGDKANTGLQVSAFYSYPSPLEDKGYLILKGTYQANLTETKVVTYQIPFVQTAADGSSLALEINPNHRYIIGITKADEYHLDFTLEVDDWADSGDIDGYNPETSTVPFEVNIDAANGDYDPDTRIVNMAITDGAAFSVKASSNSGIDYSLTYEKKVTTAPWLVVAPTPVTRTVSKDFTYTVSRNAEYKGNDFPIAYLRFIDKATGDENLLIIRPVATPVVKLATASPKCSFDENTRTITLYKDETSGKTSVTLNIISTGGCILADAAGGDIPGWLERNKDELTVTTGTIKFSLNSDDTSFPATKQLTDGYTFDIKNAKNTDKKLSITVKVETAMSLHQSASTVPNGGNYDAASNRMRLYNSISDQVTLSVFALQGCDIEGVPAWLTLDKTTTSNDSETFTFYVKDAAATGGSATITIKEKFDNTLSKTFTVYSINKSIVLSNFTASNVSHATVDNINNTKPYITFFPISSAYFKITVKSPKSIKNKIAVANWMQQPSITENIDPNTGVATSTLQFYRKNDDSYFSTPTSATINTITNDYTPGGDKQFYVQQTTPIYPGSTTIPKIATGKSRQYWVAPVVAKGDCLFSDKNVCPSGWKIASKNDYIDILHSSAEGINLSYANETAKQNAAVFNSNGSVAGPYFWSTDAYWYATFDPSAYRLNSNNSSDTNKVRCIQNK
ncbi:MAG: hypothetical protein PARBA_01370 [Parabacteroides sp.]